MEARSSTPTIGLPALHRLLARCRLPLAIVVTCCTALFGVAIFGYTIFLLFHPIHAPSISVASASVSAFSVSASSVSGVWNVSFDSRNTNKKVRASYENVQASVHYKQAELSLTSIPRFEQGVRNETTVRTTLSATGAHVDPSIISALNVERAASGSVNFTMELTAEIKYKAPWWGMRSTLSEDFHATCHEISVALPDNSNNGTLAGGSKECATPDRSLLKRILLIDFCFVVVVVVVGFLAFLRRG